MIPTPHIEVENKNLFAKNVIISGDPLRSKMIAEHYLNNPKLINTVRNMLAYTGTYTDNQKITIMSHGIGMPSAGIYTNELYNIYDINKIIRIGTCGSYVPSINLHDIVLVTESYCESNFIEIVTGEKTHNAVPTKDLTKSIELTAKNLQIPLIKTKAHCTDVFYRRDSNDYKAIHLQHDCNVVEMESAALFANAKLHHKEAACLLSVTDSFITKESLTSQQRQSTLEKIIKIALENLK